MVRVALDTGYYARLDAAMRARGYSTTILSLHGDEDRAMQLPPGHYWLDEPTDEERMRDDAWDAVQELGIFGAQIVATSGLSAWRGLLPAGWES
jgi:hypothetical protein